MVPPPQLLAVILALAPASAPVQQHGSSVQGNTTMGLGQEEGFLSCDAVITEASVSLLCWMDGAMLCPDQG